MVEMEVKPIRDLVALGSTRLRVLQALLQRTLNVHETAVALGSTRLRVLQVGQCLLVHGAK